MSIFDKLEALHQHQEIHDPPSAWLLHRFLASDQDYALVAKMAAQDIWDDGMVVGFWRTIIPKQEKPYLPYVAPSKPDAPEELAKRAMEVYHYNRREAEEAIQIIQLAGKTQELARYLGVELGGSS